MSGEHSAEHAYTGIKRWFNSSTVRGRATFAATTYAVTFGLFLYFKMRKPKETKAVTAK